MQIRLFQKTVLFFSLVDRDKVSRFRSGVFGSWPNEAIVSALLEDVRRPASGAGDDKQGGEHRSGNSAEMKCRGTVEIEIGKELFFAPHYCFDALGNWIESLVPGGGSQFARPLLNDTAARVRGFIDAMAETHDELFPSQHLQQAGFGFIGSFETLN